LSRPKDASATPELDTIIGRHHRQAIVSVVERKSKLTLLAKVERNTAAAVQLPLTPMIHPPFLAP
jgi:transposase, IS30 family